MTLYCASCGERLEDEGVKNPQGFLYQWYCQLCKGCRTSDVMEEADLERAIGLRAPEGTPPGKPIKRYTND